MDTNKFRAVTVAGVLLILVLQIVSVIYIRKKFDDNIVILQSSENAVHSQVTSIESMLHEMQNTGTFDKKASPSGSHG